MNDLESLRATVEHRRPGRVLFHAGFTPDLLRRVKEHIGSENIAGHYGFARTRGVSPKRPDDLPPLDYSRYYADGELPEGTKFNAHGAAQIPVGYYHFFHYVSPLRNAKSLKEIEDYPFDDYAAWDTSHMKAAVDAAHAEGRYVVGGVGHIFESAWQIRGLEQFIEDTLAEPAWSDCLLERVATQARAKAVAAARAGADIIHCGDDVASQSALMFSPDMWREKLHSHWRGIWEEVKRVNPTTRIWYHSDGNIMDIVGDLVDAGVDILNPVQPECIDEDLLHREFGGHLTFDGCIGTQSTMPFGTPEDVRARVKSLIEKFGGNGGLILAPTHTLEPEVPLENIDAFADACREFGQFE